MKDQAWMGVGAAFGIGALLGFLVGSEWRQSKLQKSYEESLASHKRAIEISMRDISDDEEIRVGGEITVASTGELDPNTYREAQEAVQATDFDTFVEGGINDYGISYIEEEEYFEEDGREKYQITIMMDDVQPLFIMDNQPIDDWDSRIGQSILVDFYKLVPPGIDPVLYVRNHERDEDYEVTREVP